MKLENFISNCRNRKVIEKRGKLVSVPCGHCPDCACVKSNKLTHMCKEESKKWKYHYFITLTYDEQHVPLARIVPVGQQMHLFEYTMRDGKKSSNHGDYLGTLNVSMKDNKFQQFYEKAQQSKNGRLPLDRQLRVPVLRYARTKDLQNFIKRCRFYSCKECNTSFRYFAVSEYGPTSFRPHFHVSIYFNSHLLRNNIERIVDQSWKYGNKDRSFANRSTSCVDYVASYTNNLTTLPVYLSLKALKPKSLHSVYFGETLTEEIRQFFYADVRRTFEPATHLIASNFFNYVPSTRLDRQLFPRCYDYGNKDRATLYQLYTSFERYRNEIVTARTPSDLARCILVNNDLFRDFLTQLDIITPNKFPIRPDERYLTLFEPEHYQEIYWYDKEPDELDLTTYNRLYSVLSMSKHFLEICLQLNCSSDYLLDKIIEYYDKVEKYRLKTQYKMQEEYYRETSSDNYDLFYFMGPDVDYDEVYNNSSYIKNINHAKNLQYHNKIKHKELNDLNNIFTNF